MTRYIGTAEPELTNGQSGAHIDIGGEDATAMDRQAVSKLRHNLKTQLSKILYFSYF